MAVLTRRAGEETRPRADAVPAGPVRRLPWAPVVFWLYAATLMLPILWMFLMSIRPNEDILGGFELVPDHVTFDNYRTFFTDGTWKDSYLNSITYTSLNAVMSLVVAVPAAYAFSLMYFLVIQVVCFVFFTVLTRAGR